MFTGIVTDIGTIESVTPLNSGVRLRIGTAYDPASIDIGDQLFGDLPDGHGIAA